MSLVLSWHNSEVRAVQDLTHDDGTVRIVLSAGHVLRQAPDDVDANTDAVWGFIKPLVVILSQARYQGDLADGIGSLSSGELYTGEPPHATPGARQLPLPWRTTQSVQITLQFHNGSALTVHATGASCEPGDGARFIESYAC